MCLYACGYGYVYVSSGSQIPKRSTANKELGLCMQVRILFFPRCYLSLLWNHSLTFTTFSELAC